MEQDVQGTTARRGGAAAAAAPPASSASASARVPSAGPPVGAPGPSDISATATSSSGGGNPELAQELPFLVTHWLANYNGGAALAPPGSSSSSGIGEGDGTAGRREEALRKLRRAASEVASAFADLGAYGAATAAPLTSLTSSARSNGPAGSRQQLRNATFSDVNRRWADLPPNHLDAIVESSAAATSMANQLALSRSRPTSILDAAYEGPSPGAASSQPATSRGRRVGHRNNAQVAASQSVGHDDEGSTSVPSILQPPALLAALKPPSPSSAQQQPLGKISNLAAEFVDTVGATVDEAREDVLAAGVNPPSGPKPAAAEAAALLLPQRFVTAAVGSDLSLASTRAAVASRTHLDLRTKLASEDVEIRSIQRSVSSQKRTRDEMIRRRDVVQAIVGTTGAAAVAAKAEAASMVMASGGSSDDDALDLTVIESKLNDAERVIAQLGRKLTELQVTHMQTESALETASVEVGKLWSEYVSMQKRYQDPFAQTGGGGGSTSSSSSLPINFSACGIVSRSLLSSVVGRQHCAGGSWRQQTFSSSVLRPAGRIPGRADLVGNRKSILMQRMSHAVTVNCHLYYPVFCLKFDKTGQYFLTGADDHLVKLFHIGAGISSVGRNRGGQMRFNYGANNRGAVLVCTLRGHAGVITDIDVSADNALLATASEDGDVRIWGLKDGCPVAILRGHKGGANMVSWSVLTPYRIVTTGDDGLARIWDVREAALKRYGGIISKRSDYTLPKVRGTCDSSSDEEEEEGEEEGEDAEEDDVVLPPIPVRTQDSDDGEAAPPAINGHAANPPPVDADNVVGDEPANAENNDDDNGVVVPPLPPGAEGMGAGGLVGAGILGSGRNNGNNAAPGAFLANDTIDEGVRLIAKLQHGEIVPDSQLQGPGTRSQRKAVKVVCVTRCPVGGHFATGSDDGLGRVWADEDDDRVARLDAWAREQDEDCGKGSTTSSALQSGSSSLGKSDRRGRRKSGRLRSRRHGSNGAVVPSRSTLLATLHGHLNSITDIQYSNAGDRILTASQKDGVVRIWSWGTESVSVDANVQSNMTHSPGAGAGKVRFDSIKQILIRLTPPSASGATPSRSTNTSSARRRGGSSAGGTSANRSGPLDVMCDIAIWTSDDSKVVTSQCNPLKETGQEIVPGSQIFYVWDSRTGQCLLGMPSAHTAPVPVLVTHPSDPSILASAGGDGRVNVWDLDTGKKFFSHHNTLTHGPIEPPNPRGRNCAYLDGSFSPDGLGMVLTDDMGRLTVIDTLCSAETVRKMKLASASTPTSQNEEGTSANPITMFTREQQFISTTASSQTAPAWMKEQYCANDYYELIYDANGYCVERGSEQPPHLAPKAVRCTHTGTPHPDFISESFSKLFGPLPLPEARNRWERDTARMGGVEVRKDSGLLSQNVQGKRTAINVHSVDVGRCGARSSMTSLLKRMGVFVGDQGSQSVERTSIGSTSAPTRSSPDSRRRSPNRASSSSGRALSSNYRWMDYDDVLREEGQDDDDTDDEEYDEAPRGRRLNANDDESESSDSMELDDEEYTGRSSRRSNGNRSRNRSQGSSSRSQRRNRRNDSRDQAVRFEEAVENQPSRVSSRQGAASRRVYDEPDSSDDDLVELMSTNTTPSGDHVEDYTVLGHLFRLPENGQVHRQWLCRMESHSGNTGKRLYAPQVGDSVVYIPKAHYDTIKAFPTGNNSSAPWKSWPNSSAWPVVRCVVHDIRYRFPYEQYYRNRGGNSITSVVAILTLEVTGIPISSDGAFPWPKPEFISRQTRSSGISFEVSVFEGDEMEFIVPEHLYTWKIKTLESAIHESNDNAAGLELKCYFAPSEDDDGADEEDAELIPYPCTVTDLVFSRRDREFHFKNSGYNAFGVQWENADVSQVAAWEAIVAEKMDEMPSPPSFSQEEKSALTKVLDKLEEDPLVQSWFVHPVDTRKYSDYLNMIEVPMDLTIIKTRLSNDYYTNMLSIGADFKLIRANCTKYNERHSDIAEAAFDMYDKFQEMSSDIQQRAASSPQRNRRSAQNESSPTSSSRFTRRGVGATGTSSATRSSSRLTRSSLERLPQQSEEEKDEESDQEAEDHTTRRQVRASTRTRTSSPPVESRRATRATSVSRPAAEENGGYQTPQSDEDDGEEEGQPSGRMRIRIPSRAAAASSTQATSRSTRSPAKKVSYQEIYSDADDESASPDESDEEEEEEKEEEVEPPRARASKRAATSRSSPRERKGSSNVGKYVEVDSDAEEYQESEHDEGSESESDDDENEPPRVGRGTKRSAAVARSRRALSRKQPARRRQDHSSDDDGEGSSEEEDENPRGGRGTKRSASAGSRRVSPRKQPARRRRGQKDSSDEEESASEEEDDAASVSSDEFVPGSRQSTKRRKATSARKTGGTKKSRLSELQETKSGDLYYPTLTKWPPIVHIKKFTKVSKNILDVLSEADSEDIFACPVPEAYPEVADAYLRCIPDPIDFRTILEERVPVYQDLSELQDDLISVFKNCCTFNGEGSEYYHYAINIWRGLNDVFRKACEEEGITVPRRWG